jgi:hypothetical protein
VFFIGSFPQRWKPLLIGSDLRLVEEGAEKVLPARELSPQRLKPGSGRDGYRSAEALRHPKAGILRS